MQDDHPTIRETELLMQIRELHQIINTHDAKMLALLESIKPAYSAIVSVELAAKNAYMSSVNARPVDSFG